jgi:hypothetical protein
MPCLKTNLVSLEKILEITGRKINCLCFLQTEKKRNRMYKFQSIIIKTTTYDVGNPGSGTKKICWS